MHYKRSGVLLVKPLQPDFGLLAYYLPYRMLGSALAAELAVIAAAMLLLTGAIVLTARYWNRHLLRRTHAEASRALESELMNHILVSATPVGVCIVRQCDYAVLMTNQLAQTLLQLQACERLPDTVADAFDRQPRRAGSGPASIASFTVAAPPRTPDENSDPPGEALPATGDRGQRFLQVTYAPARYRDDEVLFCAVQDCTAQQTLHEQLRSAQQATEAMMRVRATFFAAMSHEIRTPLNALLGNLELLARSSGLEADAPRLRALDTAAEAQRRSGAAAQRQRCAGLFQDRCRQAEAGRRTVPPHRCAGKPGADLRADGGRLRHPLPPAPVAFAGRGSHRRPHAAGAGDQQPAEQRAFKFTASGRITLSGEIRQDEHGAQRLACRVTDSGIDMPPSLVARVFQPFVQGDTVTASRYGGTGLGLSICARLCDDGRQHRRGQRAGRGQRLHGLGAAAAGGRRGDVMVLCQDARTGEYLEAWLNAAGWHANVLGSLAAAQETLHFKVPEAIVATDEYPLATLAGLREAAAVSVVWVTLEDPHRPRQPGPGILEVTAFSHRALLDCVALAADSAAQALPGPARPTPTILVAEDNPLNQTLIPEQLQTLGCQPIVVGNGKQALAVLETTRVDAVLTDIHMPVMDGHQFLAAVRAQHRGVPVLAFSALTRSESSGDWASTTSPDTLPSRRRCRTCKRACAAWWGWTTLASVRRPGATPRRKPAPVLRMAKTATIPTTAAATKPCCAASWGTICQSSPTSWHGTTCRHCTSGHTAPRALS